MVDKTPPKNLNEQLNEVKYIPKKGDMPELSETVKKEIEKQKKELDKLKNWVTKKLPTNSIPIQFVMNTENSSQLFLGFTSLSK